MQCLLVLFLQLGPDPLGPAGDLLVGLVGHLGRRSAHHRAGPPLQRGAPQQLVEPRTAVPARRRPGLQREPQPEGCVVYCRVALELLPTVYFRAIIIHSERTSS